MSLCIIGNDHFSRQEKRPPTSLQFGSVWMLLFPTVSDILEQILQALRRQYSVLCRLSGLVTRINGFSHDVPQCDRRRSVVDNESRFDKICLRILRSCIG